MDKLLIKGLELFAFHGVLEEEKQLGQKFILDAEVSYDMEAAGASDSIKYTINYATLAQEIKQVVSANKYNLIEHLCYLVIEDILTRYETVQQVQVTLKKPWAPLHMPIEYPAVCITRSWHSTYIALGSNLGDRAGYINVAISTIAADPRFRRIEAADLIETKPVGYLDQADFLNTVIRCDTLLSPDNLMHYLLGIERQLDRQRTIPNGPRTIDLDILYYDQQILSNQLVTIPHPRMHLRRFVLQPLLQLAPNLHHPIYRQTTAELLAALADTD